MKKKVLIIATNTSTYGSSKRPTGLWLSELVHFYDIMEIAGYEQTIASPRGGEIPIDPRSLRFYATDKHTKRRLCDQSFMDTLKNSTPIEKVRIEEYDVLFFTGGHGTMWDFPENETLQAFSKAIYEKGAVLASVCHGYCALLNVKLSDGTNLVQGMSLTGYSWIEEVLAGVARHVPFNTEKEMRERGALYKKAVFPFSSFMVSDKGLITGQNPFSTKKVAEEVVRSLHGDTEAEDD